MVKVAACTAARREAEAATNEEKRCPTPKR